MLAPLSSIPRQRTNQEFHSASDISAPVELNHMMSLIVAPRIGRPWKNRLAGRTELSVTLSAMKLVSKSCVNHAITLAALWTGQHQATVIGFDRVCGHNRSVSELAEDSRVL